MRYTVCPKNRPRNLCDFYTNG